MLKRALTDSWPPVFLPRRARQRGPIPTYLVGQYALRGAENNSNIAIVSACRMWKGSIGTAPGGGVGGERGRISGAGGDKHELAHWFSPSLSASLIGWPATFDAGGPPQSRKHQLVRMHGRCIRGLRYALQTRTSAAAASHRRTRCVRCCTASPLGPRLRNGRSPARDRSSGHAQKPEMRR